ncbi:hypothetical protein V8F06_003482 [Rhypophila decipiens]
MGNLVGNLIILVWAHDMVAVFLANDPLYGLGRRLSTYLPIVKRTGEKSRRVLFSVYQHQWRSCRSVRPVMAMLSKSFQQNSRRMLENKTGFHYVCIQRRRKKCLDDPRLKPTKPISRLEKLGYVPLPCSLTFGLQDR